MVGYTGSPQGDGGPAALAGLVRPASITLDPFGNVFFMEQYWLRRIDGKTGIITTIAPRRSNSGTGTSGDGGPYNKALLENVSALATDSKGNLYIADEQHLREINWSSGIISTIAGSGQKQYAGDGVPGLQANLALMTGLVVDAQGNIWIADNGNTRLFVIPAATGLIKTVAGTTADGDGGPALGALFQINTAGIVANAQGDLYIASGGLRRIDHITGIISTVAFGQTQIAYGVLGDGTEPLAVDSSGNVFLSTQTSVERIDPVTGSMTTVAGGSNGGQGGGGPLGDGGPATQAQVTPAGVAVDSSGNLYIADYWNYRIRRVDAATGIISTVAGNGQAQPFSGLTRCCLTGFRDWCSDQYRHLSGRRYLLDDVRLGAEDESRG